MKTLLALTLMGVLTACSSPLVRMSTEPPPDIDRSKGRVISAEACGFQLIQLFPLGTNDRQQRAYELLKEQAGGDFIGDVVNTETWQYGVIGSVYCTQLDAKAYPKGGRL